MQILFAWDAVGNDDPKAAEQIVSDFTGEPEVRARAKQMAISAWAMRETSDAWLQRLAPQWPPRRQPAVYRALLRMAVWEMTATDTPPKVVLDETIEMAKEFSTEQSAAFVNGLLDAVLKEKRALTGEAPPAEDRPIPQQPAEEQS